MFTFIYKIKKLINFIIEKNNNNIYFKNHIDMVATWGLLKCFILIPIIVL